MSEPKFALGQKVYHTKCIDRCGEVYARYHRGDGVWLYQIDEGNGREQGLGGYPESVLSSEPVTERPKPKLHYKVDFGGLDAWMGEVTLLFPPEEGYGFQPTIDLFNHITAHREGLRGAIEQFCKKVGIENPIDYNTSKD